MEYRVKNMAKKMARAGKKAVSPDNQLLWAVERDACIASFYEFVKSFWGVIIKEVPVYNWHIPYLCRELQMIAERVVAREAKLYDLLINIPPGTTKSTIVTIMYPVWLWTQDPTIRVITNSYSADLATEHSVKSRDIIQSEKFQWLFPEVRIRADKFAKMSYENTRTGARYVSSTGGTVAGKHAHVIINDDPLNPGLANSDNERETANYHLSVLSSRKVAKELTPTITIMQRLHQNDPSGHLLKRKGEKLKHICLPGELRNYGQFVHPEELRQHYVDDLLDPVRLGWEQLSDMMEDLGQYGYAGQVGQNPTPPGGGMFKVDHFQIVNTIPSPGNVLESVRYWDKAGTAGGGAFTTGVKMLRLKDGKYFVENVKRGQWSTEERERIIRQTAEADGPKVHVMIEQEPGSGGKESAENTIRNLAGFIIYADRPVGDKAKRADPYSVQVNNGNVLLMAGLWNVAFIEEHRFFPLGTYKDQVDASAAGFNYLSRKRQVRRIT